MPTQTEEYCRGIISQLTDLQPENLLHWLANLLSIQRIEVKKIVQRSTSLACTVYTMYLLFLIVVVNVVGIIVYRTFCRR